MTRKFSLQPLIELMQTRTDDATRELGKLIAAEQNAKSRLEMLEQYRTEYVERLRQSIAAGITRQALANHQDFLARIEEAIGQQTGLVTQAAESTAAGQRHWRAQNSRLKALDTLSERHSERLRKMDDKREQKLLDEFSTRQFFDKDSKNSS